QRWQEPHALVRRGGGGGEGRARPAAGGDELRWTADPHREDRRPAARTAQQRRERGGLQVGRLRRVDTDELAWSVGGTRRAASSGAARRLLRAGRADVRAALRRHDFPAGPADGQASTNLPKPAAD